jgi:hypothetical protein
MSLAVREGRALLAGGLRVRSGLNQRLAMTAHLRLAALLGFGLMLLQLASWDVEQIISFSRRHFVPPGIGQVVAYLVLTVVVLLAVFFAPRRLAWRGSPPRCGSGGTVTTARASWPRYC